MGIVIRFFQNADGRQHLGLQIFLFAQEHFFPELLQLAVSFRLNADLIIQTRFVDPGHRHIPGSVQLPYCQSTDYD
jgi:hypothetical protein